MVINWSTIAMPAKALARSLKKLFSSSVKKGTSSIERTGALRRWSADQCTSLMQKRAQ